MVLVNKQVDERLKGLDTLTTEMLANLSNAMDSMNKFKEETSTYTTKSQKQVLKLMEDLKSLTIEVLITTIFKID